MPYSSGLWSLRSKCWLIWFLMRGLQKAAFLLEGCPQMEEGDHLSHVFSSKGTNPTHGGSTLMPWGPLKASPPDTIALGLRASTCGFWGDTNIQSTAERELGRGPWAQQTTQRPGHSGAGRGHVSCANRTGADESMHQLQDETRQHGRPPHSTCAWQRETLKTYNENYPQERASLCTSAMTRAEEEPQTTWPLPLYHAPLLPALRGGDGARKRERDKEKDHQLLFHCRCLAWGLTDLEKRREASNWRWDMFDFCCAKYLKIKLFPRREERDGESYGSVMVGVWVVISNRQTFKTGGGKK